MVRDPVPGLTRDLLRVRAQYLGLEEAPDQVRGGLPDQVRGGFP
jgi:hypothetical protein